MINAGQAKRIMRVYGVSSRRTAPGDIMRVAHTVRDPQGAYADARALSDWIQAYPYTDLTNVVEDATPVAWSYKRIYSMALDAIENL